MVLGVLILQHIRDLMFTDLSFVILKGMLTTQNSNHDDDNFEISVI